MTKYPDNYKYTKEHEWVKVLDGIATVGITDYATEQLGDVVHLELPQMTSEFESGDTFGVVESVKSVSDIYSPVAGKIVDVNTLLTEHPGMINEDPYNEGWLVKLEINDKKEIDALMSSEAYEAFLAEET